MSNMSSIRTKIIQNLGKLQSFQLPVTVNEGHLLKYVNGNDLPPYKTLLNNMSEGFFWFTG